MKYGPNYKQKILDLLDAEGHSGAGVFFLLQSIIEENDDDTFTCSLSQWTRLLALTHHHTTLKYLCTFASIGLVNLQYLDVTPPVTSDLPPHHVEGCKGGGKNKGKYKITLLNRQKKTLNSKWLIDRHNFIESNEINDVYQEVNLTNKFNVLEMYYIIYIINNIIYNNNLLLLYYIIYSFNLNNFTYNLNLESISLLFKKDIVNTISQKVFHPLPFPTQRSKKTKPPKPDLLPQAQEIFDYWRRVMETPRSVFDKNRQKYIFNALKYERYDESNHKIQAFTVDDLKLAIDGCKKSGWHMGNNPNKTFYNDIKQIFKDPAQIEKFISLSNQELGMNDNQFVRGI